jgi:hypothetical protein
VNRWYRCSERPTLQQMADPRAASGPQVHAKEMGVSQTACGVRSENLVKYYDQPYTAGVNSCPDCSRITSGSRPRTAAPAPATIAYEPETSSNFR